MTFQIETRSGIAARAARGCGRAGGSRVCRQPELRRSSSSTAELWGAGGTPCSSPAPAGPWQGSGPALQCPEDQVVAEPGAAVRCSWDKHSPRQPLELLSRTRRPLSSNPSQKRCADTAGHHGKFVLFWFYSQNPTTKSEMETGMELGAGDRCLHQKFAAVSEISY